MIIAIQWVCRAAERKRPFGQVARKSWAIECITLRVAWAAAAVTSASCNAAVALQMTSIMNMD